MKALTIGFSPCPNDTYIFNRMVNTVPRSGDPVFEPPRLEDVETLNRWAFEHRLDVTKLSYHAVGHLLEEYCVLPSGGALGYGCGPLLVTGSDVSIDDLARKRIAIPGKYTTAALLFRMFLPECTDLVEMRFEQIMAAICNGVVDGGVIIHESRFTYQAHGLICLQDLGAWWENTSGMAIPLGCIAARRSLGPRVISDIDRLIKASLTWASLNRREGRAYTKQYAQETDEAVVQSHINLYVNDFSYDLGEEGRCAVETFLSRARDKKILPESSQPIFCL